MRAHEYARQASELVGGARESQHGDKVQNFENIAAIWNAYLMIRHNGDLNGKDVGIMMQLLKIARTCLGDHNPDDYIDSIGYAACTAEVAECIYTADTWTGEKVNISYSDFQAGQKQGPSGLPGGGPEEDIHQPTQGNGQYAAQRECGPDHGGDV